MDTADQMTEEDINLFYATCLKKPSALNPETLRTVTFSTSANTAESQMRSSSCHLGGSNCKDREEDNNFSLTDHLKKQSELSRVLSYPLLVEMSMFIHELSIHVIASYRNFASFTSNVYSFFFTVFDCFDCIH